jgi:glycine/D-amino acid oxidase-like deaminating enzyme
MAGGDHVGETFYFKPDAGLLLLSPADETPSAPCDAQPEEIDIAIAVNRFETATGHAVGRVRSRWAGLRSFVADKSPVVGFDPSAAGFFWLVGQGGYGIQTAPAMARAASALAQRKALPDDLRAPRRADRPLAPTGRRCAGPECRFDAAADDAFYDLLDAWPQQRAATNISPRSTKWERWLNSSAPMARR